MYKISDNGVKLICAFEGFVSKPYLDQVGVPTIGFGTTFYPDGREVTMRDAPITREVASAYLKNYIDKLAIPAIERMVKVSLTQNQVDALCSFIYNVGAGALQKSTLLRKINAKAPIAEIKAAFGMWTKANGKTLKALVTRRAREAALYGS